MRIDWTELPTEIQAAVEAHTGQVGSVVPAAEGNHANIASTVHGGRGSVFVKAARKQAADQDGAEVRSLRWENAINPHVSEFAPRLLDSAEAGGWFAIIFEHVDGRRADFAPDSPDLEVLAKTVDALQSTAAPDALKKYVQRRWESVVDDVTPMAGDQLLHADLNPANFLITADRVYLVDWAFVARGAAWVEPALLMPWLLQAGHEPGDAERWLSRIGSWADADPAHLDLFAGAFAAKWAINLENNSEPWAVKLAAAARAWAHYRLDGPSASKPVRWIR
ncbi:phosphotransferase [Actinomadura fulvescens]|uniref:Aminoglycoside phosphotransferase n=1 Tax=Actinomadura fulvescens TaxID=46160 RepID=A0ABN3QKF7_9ACTN